MLRKLRFLFLAVLVLSMTFLAACGGDSVSPVGSDKVDPKALLSEAMIKSMEIKSYAFEGDLVVSLDFPDSMLAAEPELEMIASLFEDLKLNYRGAFQTDIEKAEFVFETNINLGDLKTTLEVPILVQKEKIWVKIPAIPGIVPDDFAGKQLELDLKELAEMSGDEYISVFETADSETATQLAVLKKIGEIFVKNLDDALFTLSKEDGQNIVTVDLSGDKFHSTLETFFESFIPEFVKLLEEDESVATLFGLSVDDLAELKEFANGLPEEVKEELQKAKEHVKVNKGKFVFYLDKENYITAESVDFDLTITDPESAEEFNLLITSDQIITKINEEQEFTLDAPTEDIIDFSGLLGMFMPMGMAGDFDSEEFNMEEFDMNMDASEQLLFTLFEEEWFNTSEIQEELISNPNLQLALMDVTLLQNLLDDEEFRKTFFREYDIELE